MQQFLTEGTTPATLTELQDWMTQNYVNDHAFRVGPTWPSLADGFGVTEEDGRFLFFYVERGQRSHVEHFDLEAQVCERALFYLQGDKWSSAHPIGFFPDRADALALQARLAAAGIDFHADQIPYGGPGDLRYRVLVFGKDVVRAEALLAGSPD